MWLCLVDEQRSERQPLGMLGIPRDLADRQSRAFAPPDPFLTPAGDRATLHLQTGLFSRPALSSQIVKSNGFNCQLYYYCAVFGGKRPSANDARCALQYWQTTAISRPGPRDLLSAHGASIRGKLNVLS